MYDIVIIGGGPAGFSSAITAFKRNLKTCMIYPKNNDSWLTKLPLIDNYPGMIDVSGKEMLDTFERQVKKMNVNIINGVVTQIMNMGTEFYINLGAEVIQAKKIIIATGIKQTSLIEGETNFVGKGVSYCATCDGMLYRNKTIMIVDEMNDIEEVKLLSNLANKVYLLSRFSYEGLNTNVELINDKAFSINGKEIVEEVITKNGKYEVDGIFIFRSSMALDSLLPELKMKDKFIIVNDKMETNIPNVFACGDCVGYPFQVAKAVGEGNVAAISASMEYKDPATRNIAN